MDSCSHSQHGEMMIQLGLLPHIPDEPTISENSRWRAKAHDSHHSKKVANRRTTILEIDEQYLFLSPPPEYEESTLKNKTTPPPHYSPLAPSYRSRNSIWRQSHEPASPFHEDPRIASSVALNQVSSDLDVASKSFQYPSELDFSESTESPLLFENETNAQFNDQFRRLNELRVRLAEIPTHGDDQLEAQDIAIRTAIDRALQEMTEHRRKLLKQLRQAVPRSAELLDNLHADLNDCIDSFEYPQFLDLCEDAKGELILMKTGRNRPFITQLSELESFLGELDRIPTYNNAQLQRKHRDTRVDIKKALTSMRRHQHRLYVLSTGAYQPSAVA